MISQKNLACSNIFSLQWLEFQCFCQKMIWVPQCLFLRTGENKFIEVWVYHGNSTFRIFHASSFEILWYRFVQIGFFCDFDQFYLNVRMGFKVKLKRKGGRIKFSMYEMPWVIQVGKKSPYKLFLEVPIANEERTFFEDMKSAEMELLNSEEN